MNAADGLQKLEQGPRGLLQRGAAARKLAVPQVDLIADAVLRLEQNRRAAGGKNPQDLPDGGAADSGQYSAIDFTSA